MQWLARSQDQVQIVQAGDDQAAALGMAQQHVEQQTLMRGVEMRRRLVEQQQRRALQQRCGERHTLPLAARQGSNVGLRQALQIEASEQVGERAVAGRIGPERPAAAAPVAGQHRRLGDGRSERIEPELRAPGAAAGELAGRPRLQGTVVNTNLAGGDREHARQGRQQR